jgi:hypothetical protein
MASRGLPFQKLSDSTTVYQPPQDVIDASDKDDAPRRILILGWLGATARNMTRHAQKYNDLYPGARIVVVTSNLTTDIPGFQMFKRTEYLEWQAEIPAKTLIGDLGSRGPVRLLVHAFSNGGAMALANIAKGYRCQMNFELPARCIIFDSCPGGDTWRGEHKRWETAIAIGGSTNPLIRWPMKIINWIFVLIILWLPLFLGNENAMTQTRRELLDDSLIQEEAKRLFLYSEADALVGAQDVRDFAAESAALGYEVELDNFGETRHIMHAMRQPERYWNAVLAA